MIGIGRGTLIGRSRLGCLYRSTIRLTAAMRIPWRDEKLNEESVNRLTNPIDCSCTDYQLTNVRHEEEEDKTSNQFEENSNHRNIRSMMSHREYMWH